MARLLRRVEDIFRDGGGEVEAAGDRGGRTKQFKVVLPGMEEERATYEPSEGSSRTKSREEAEAEEGEEGEEGRDWMV